MTGSITPDLTSNPFADDDAIPDESKPMPDRSPSSAGAGLAGLQQDYWDAQDVHLDVLTSSLTRQHEMSLQMNQELDLHHDLLQEFDGDVDRTGLHLGGATSQLDTVRRKLNDHGSIWAIAGLIIFLILLIAMFK